MALPNGYKQLEYIQSSGGQYIDTGFKPNGNTSVHMDAQLTSKPTTAHEWVFGARDGSSLRRFDILWNRTGYWQSAYNTTYLNFTSTSATDRVYIKAKKNTCTIGTTTVSHTYGSFQTQCTLALFAVNTAGTIDNHARMKLYSCQIYDNGTLIRDFVPCETNTGEIGLWDDVNSKFYGNKGSGSFIAGYLRGKHKTVLADGTERNIRNGFALVEGTSRKIKRGRTLIDGTGYNIDFYSDEFVIVIDSYGYHETGGWNGSNLQAWKNLAYVTIDGIRYDSDAIVLAKKGSEIVCRVSGSGTNKMLGGSVSIVLNGETVFSSLDSNAVGTYTFLLTGNVDISLSSYEIQQEGTPEPASGRIEITTRN